MISGYLNSLLNIPPHDDDACCLHPITCTPWNGRCDTMLSYFKINGEHITAAEFAAYVGFPYDFMRTHAIVVPHIDHGLKFNASVITIGFIHINQQLAVDTRQRK